MPEDGSPQFPTTEWTMILAAGTDGSIATPALERLCRKYWWPLFGFARRSGLTREEAEDAVQTYLQRVIARGNLSGLVRDGARFRSWLLCGMEHAMADLRRHGSALKRGGGQYLSSLDENTDVPGCSGLTAAETYDCQWAQTVMLNAVTRLRTEQATAGKAVAYRSLEPVVTGQDKTAYATLAKSLGTSEKNIALVVHRLRSRLRDIIRAEVAQTVANPEELDDELHYLLSLFVIQ